MCSLTRLYAWVDTAICVSWYSHMCRLIRIYSLKSDAYRVKKRLWQLVRASPFTLVGFYSPESRVVEKEGISIKKIPFIALSWHPRFLFYSFELSLSPINIGWAFTWLILVIYERWICRKISWGNDSSATTSLAHRQKTKRQTSPPSRPKEIALSLFVHMSRLVVYWYQGLYKPCFSYRA